jgi:hypothetical protein
LTEPDAEVFACLLCERLYVAVSPPSEDACDACLEHIQIWEGKEGEE